MRQALILGVFLSLASGANGQDAAPSPRYGIAPRLAKFPQSTPQETLASVIAAIEDRRTDYLLAQLVDPEFVDKRVREVYGGNFDELVKETTTKLSKSPGTMGELRRFLSTGQWETTDAAATAKLKEVAGKQVYLRKVGKRWYFQNRVKS